MERSVGLMRNWFGVIAVVVSVLAGQGAEADTAAPKELNPSSVAPAPAKPPEVQVKCLLVGDKGLFARLFGGLSATPARKASDGMTVEPPPQTCKKPALPAASQTLVGTGDLEIVIDTGVFRSVLDWEQDATHGYLVLYVNGVALPTDAQLVKVENMDDGTHMRYQINQGQESQTVFSSLYRDHGLLDADALRVAFGWKGAGPGTSFPSLAQDAPRIVITGDVQLGVAGVAMIVLIIGSLMVGVWTDALRDAALPTWWRDATNLRAQLKPATANRTEILSAFESTYDPQKEGQYRNMAVAALSGGPLPDHPQLIAIGLAVDPRPLRPVRASYSLARMQTAVWFAFAICTGLFLWIVYGELRRIDGSLLALLGLSVGTAGLSLSTDRDAGGRQYSPSRGLLNDLVTGFDDTHQVHRYQSVLVNLLLLFVGVSHVIQHLTYPVFDSTWLALAGVSGATLGLGKQILEKPPSPPPAGSGGSGPGPVTGSSPGGRAVG